MSRAVGSQALFIAALGVQEFLFRGNLFFVQSFFTNIVPLIDLVGRLRLKEVGFLLTQFDAVQEGQHLSCLDLLTQLRLDLDDPAFDTRAEMHQAIFIGLDRGRGRDFITKRTAFYSDCLKRLSGQRFGRD